jgi:hypothetical protein
MFPAALRVNGLRSGRKRVRNLAIQLRKLGEEPKVGGQRHPRIGEKRRGWAKSARKILPAAMALKGETPDYLTWHSVC